MITIPGQLSVRTINGRHGPFNVGRLATSIGEFTVKDPQLDQFNEGQYEGNFLIQSIRPSSYMTNGRVVTEIRVQIGEMMLDHDGRLTSESASSFENFEPDPIDEQPAQAEEPVTPASKPSVQPMPAPTATVGNQPVSAISDSDADKPFVLDDAQPEPSPEKADSELSNADAELFGHVWPLGDSVKLDPTIDRGTLRQQANRLKQMGYRFNYQSQEWSLAVTA